MRRFNFSLVAGATLVFGCSILQPTNGLAQVQSSSQQACINAINKAGAKVASTQGKENSACVKNAGKGTVADAQACLTADPKLKVSKAKGKTVTAEASKCTAAPDFGKSPSGQVNAFAGDEEVALTADVFGANLTPAIILASADKDGAGCQAAIVKAYEKVAATKMKSFLKCKKDGLKAETILSPATLEACFDTMSADAKVAAAVAKITDTVTKKCSATDLDLAFPGGCVGAPDFTACIDAQVECRVCLTLDAMDDLTRDCDVFDDGVSNASCVTLPPTTTITTTTTSTTTTLPPAGPDWGLDCFSTLDCGSAHCPSFGAQCTDYIESVGLLTGSEMCFFDCMDDTLMDVTDCRDSCGGAAAPACETGTAGGGGFTGVVTGAGKCTPSGFAASVTLGGSATELKRLLVDFGTPIIESTVFSAAPPPCSGACPTPGSACDVGAPYPVTPFSDVFRLHIGAASPPPEVCDRLGAASTVCKFSPTGYAFILSTPGISATAAAPIDVTTFISCHVSDGAAFLHFSTGDFFAVGSWPP